MLRVNTWIADYQSDPRWKFLSEFALSHSDCITLLDNLYTNNPTDQYLREVKNADCDMFIVHKRDINNITLRDDIFFDPKHYHVITFSGATYNQFLTADKSILLDSELMIRYFDDFLSFYKESSKIDLSILFGGWCCFYREKRDNILNNFYDMETEQFKAKPSCETIIDASYFPDMQDYLSQYIRDYNPSDVSKFIVLRDMINSEIVTIVNSKTSR